MDTLLTILKIDIIKIYEYGKNGKSKRIKKSLWHQYGIEDIHHPEAGYDIDDQAGIDLKTQQNNDLNLPKVCECEYDHQI